MLFCFYVAAAEKQGWQARRCAALCRTTSSRSTWLSTPGVSSGARAQDHRDMFEWCATHTPLWNTISISGYHIREAGATAAQELAFTLANGFTYVDGGSPAGWTWTRSRRASPSSGTFTTIFSRKSRSFGRPPDLGPPHAGALWREASALRHDAVPLPDRGSHAHRAATHEQPVRVAYQALAAVLGGTQSLHTNSLDETLALRPRRPSAWPCGPSRSSRRRRVSRR